MSTLGDVVKSVNNVLNLMEDVNKIGEVLKEVSAELADHDRRLHRLEAKWETMMEIAAIQGTKTRNLVEHKDG